MAASSVSERPFGKLESGDDVAIFTLKNKRGSSVSVTTFGATLTEFHLADNEGNTKNVVLGFDNLADYLHRGGHFGATTGRFANRIAGAKFSLDGKEYALEANNGGNCLHGGTKGIDKKVWIASEVESEEEGVSSVKFSHLSPHMDSGFPGALSISVTYSLTDTNELWIEYEANSDKATPINLTNHAYFNLKGAGNGDILNHEIRIDADKYTPVDGNLIPTGAIEDVQGTPLDFRVSQPIGARIERLAGGYDCNFVLNENYSGDMKLAAQVLEPESGTSMRVYTTEPGLQFYTSNSLKGNFSGNGGVYGKYSALCLEAQHFPDSVHHPSFPNVILKPEDVYKQTTVYAFRSE